MVRVLHDPDSGPADPRRAGWGRRVLWLVVIWTASVLALGCVALLFRGIMGWVGLTG
jgi:Protein of unknown function (DUF2474)